MTSRVEGRQRTSGRYRFIADELAEKGITAGGNRVQRLCPDHGIWSVFSKKRGLKRGPATCRDSSGVAKKSFGVSGRGKAG
ncbi:hypothetical protein GCM10027405_02930 [Arthrobacter alkaliphilus]